MALSKTSWVVRHSAFVMLVREGVKLPSNLQGLFEVRYKGDTLDTDANNAAPRGDARHEDLTAYQSGPVDDWVVQT